MLMAPAELLERLIHAEQGQDSRPAEAVVALLPDVRHPAIPSLANRDLRAWIVGDLQDEYGWVEHLHVDTERIHMPDAHRDVLHLARFLRAFHVPTTNASQSSELFAGHHLPSEAANLVVHHPVLGA